MAANKSLLILPRRHWPEVMRQVRRVIDWMAKRRSVGFNVSEGLVGGAAYEAHGSALSDETMAGVLAADAVLLGAVGGPKWTSFPTTSARNAACCACARKWTCSPTCVRRWSIRVSSMPRP